jgi:hypothetical protein
MFGNPFKKDVSPAEFPNEKCRWCLQRIGLVGHYPLPLCKPCLRRAARCSALIYSCNPCWEERLKSGNPYVTNCPHTPPDFSPGLWNRMCDEFDREMRKWIKRMRSTPTASDLMEGSFAIQAEITELKKQQKQAALTNDTATIAQLEEQIREKTQAITTFKAQAPKILQDLDAHEKQGEA